MEQIQPWLPVILNLFVAAFIYGGLTVRVKRAETDIVEIKSEQDNQWTAINSTAGRVAGIEGEMRGKANGAAHGRNH